MAAWRRGNWYENSGITAAVDVVGTDYEDYELNEAEYESGGDIYENNDTAFTAAVPSPQYSHPPNLAISPVPEKSVKPPVGRWKPAAITLGVFSLTCIGVITYLAIEVSTLSRSAHETNPTTSPTEGEVTHFSNTWSCLDLMGQGVTSSGVKRLRLSSSNELRELYCDMETDGGGWTLVASIHENDIKAKCASDDRWSSYVPGSSLDGKTNWENEDVFGSVQECLNDDYKSPAYYNLNASDVMVWHVYYASKVDSMRSDAVLRYRSADKFLQQYGGNLKNLFSSYIPLSPVTNVSQIWQSLRTLSEALPDVKNVAGWYNYQMTVGHDFISDKNMSYEGFGNRVSLISTRRNISNLRYGDNYRLACDSELFCSANTPSLVLLMIRNDDALTKYYSFDVYSTRAYEPSNITELSSTRKFGSFEIHYKAIQFYQPSKRLETECRFHFYIANDQKWDSQRPTQFHMNFRNYTANVRQTIYVIEGQPERILFGYILLSKKRGQRYSKIETDEIADLIIRKVQNLPSNLLDGAARTIAVPIVFGKGSTNLVNEITPPSMRSNVQAGNLQFRAFNSQGYPNAMCPGVSVTGDTPEYVCIGGLSMNLSAYGTCGDFAGWDGMPGDERSDRHPVGHTHSSQDILSTILIFYR